MVGNSSLFISEVRFAFVEGLRDEDKEFGYTHKSWIIVEEWIGVSMWFPLSLTSCMFLHFDVFMGVMGWVRMRW